jgi:hypothetical protein
LFFFLFSIRKLVGANQTPKRGENNETKVSHRFQQFLDHKKHVEDLQKKSAEKKKNKNKFKTTTTEEDEEFPQLKQNRTNQIEIIYNVWIKLLFCL